MKSAFAILIEEAQRDRAKLQAQAAAMLEAGAKAQPVPGLTADEQKAFDLIAGPGGMVEKIDQSIANYRAAEALEARTAQPVRPALVNASGEPVAKVKQVPRYPKGCFFAAQAHALYKYDGDRNQAAEYARTVLDDPILAHAISQPRGALQAQVAQMIQAAAVTRSTTADATNVAPLIEINQNAAEFIELLRPQTIIGRVPGVRPVSFGTANTLKVKRRTAGVSGAWIGEGLPIPIAKGAFDAVTMTQRKMGVIVVSTNEALSKAIPSLLELVRDDMLEGVARTMDALFASVTAATATAPAGIYVGGSTNAGDGLLTLASIDADLKACMAGLVAANIPRASWAWLMPENALLSLQFIRDGNGNRVYAEELAGGTLYGGTVITSNSLAANVISLLGGAQVMFADDMVPEISLSQEATLSMRDDPGADLSIDASAGVVSSMFQTDSTAIRLITLTDWAKRYAGASHRRTNVGWA